MEGPGGDGIDREERAAGDPGADPRGAEASGREAGPFDVEPDPGGPEAPDTEAAAAALEPEALQPEPEGAGDEANAQERAPSGPGPGDALSDEELLRWVAALLFASPDPLSPARLAALLEHPRGERVEAAVQALDRRFQEAGLPFTVRAIAGGWRLFTAAELADVVARLARARKIEKISPAALETLAIVAYRQPVTKAEIEAIRGVQAGPILRSLVERGLVRVTGRADQPGSPLVYGTTREFLDHFGLASLGDLPRDGELVRG